MKNTILNRITQFIALSVWGLLVLSLFAVPQAFAHGGKSHGGHPFTALRALQKGTQLYDELIDNGKLDEDWETGLSHVEVILRHNKGGMEHVVSFSREKGQPQTVYFFFSAEGKYTGSNFSGK